MAITSHERLAAPTPRVALLSIDPALLERPEGRVAEAKEKALDTLPPSTSREPNPQPAITRTVTGVLACYAIAT